MAANANTPAEPPHVMPDYVKELDAEKKAKLDTLLTMDDEFLAEKDKMREEMRLLEVAFEEKAKALYAKRKALLAEAKLPGFWRQALINSHVEHFIEETDHDALDALEDLVVEQFPTKPGECPGYKLEFHFGDAQVFTNKVLTLEFHTKRTSRWDADPEFQEVKATPIDWVKGKDLTHVEKQKGKGKKKKLTKVPQPSFFWLFHDLKEGGPLPPSFDDEDDEDDDFDDEERMEDKLEEVFNFGEVVQSLVVPHAARHYTCEVVPEESDEEDEDDSELDDDDDDDDDDDSDDAPPKKGKKGAYRAMR
jgi:hypothetical protein